MCGLCLFFGQDYMTVRKKKNSLQLNRQKILSVHKTDLVLGFFFFFYVNNGAKIVPYKGFCQ